MLIPTIRRELKYCVGVVRQYIPVNKYPDIYILDSTNNLKLNGLLLPEWVKALTIKDTIYILPNGEQWDIASLKKIICHELFHASVNIYYNGRKVIPYWFNEAVAYTLVKKEFNYQSTVVEENIQECFELGTTSSIYKDINSTSFTFLDAISTYLLKHYNPQVIRKTLILAKKHGSFDRVVQATLGMDKFKLMKA